MLTKTTETGIKALIFLGLENNDGPIPLRAVADHLETSPTYLAKIFSLLVKGNVLRAHRGQAGGVTLNRPPDDISLLQIVEALQGQVVGDFCAEVDDPENVCGFHRAMHEVHNATVNILSRWTLNDLLKKPSAVGSKANSANCRMHGSCPMKPTEG